MCNDYDRHRTARELQSAFCFPELPNLEPRYVVRPTDTEHVVAIGKDGARHAVPMRWGLVPPSSKDIKIGLTMFNARSETIATSRAYAEPFAKRRCLVPLDGFFEFTGPKRQKQPYYFKPKDDRVLAFAGLWETWRIPGSSPTDKPLLSYTIATTTPNAIVAPIHDRMPVLLSEPAQWEAWLDPASTPERLHELLRPADDDLLETFPISRDLLRKKVLDASILAPIG